MDRPGGQSVAGRNRGGGAVKGSNVSLSVGTGTIVSLGDVHALYSWTPTLWRVADLTMGRFVQAQGEMRTDGQGLAGHIQINDLPLANLFPGLDSEPDVRFGHVSGTGSLAGSWSDPQGDLMTRFAGAGWKELSVEGDAHSVWKGGVGGAAFFFNVCGACEPLGRFLRRDHFLGRTLGSSGKNADLGWPNETGGGALSHMAKPVFR
jgi:hypothetical protein